MNDSFDGKREYLASHPWIDFEFNIKRLNRKTWVSLGEAQSKCEHIANTPLFPKVADQLHRMYFAKGAQGTVAIEGNTLSEQEVLDRIDGKLHLPPSKEYLGQEADNIIKACNEIGDRIFSRQTLELTRSDFEEFNQMVLQNLEIEDGVTPGEVRQHSVGVAGARYRGAPARDCEYLLDRLCKWLNTSWIPDSEDTRVIVGILKAIVAHLYIAWIHPFGDGNGRTARLVEFQILLASGVPTPAAHLLSNYYNETRMKYYAELSKSSQERGSIGSFIEYAVTGFVELLRHQVEYIWNQVWNITWESYIHEKFKRKNKPSDERRRRLALDISEAHFRDADIKVSDIRGVSARVAEGYAGKTSRTITRDIDALVSLGLLIIEEDGSIRPKREALFSLLPARRVR